MNVWYASYCYYGVGSGPIPWHIAIFQRNALQIGHDTKKRVVSQQPLTLIHLWKKILEHWYVNHLCCLNVFKSKYCYSAFVSHMHRSTVRCVKLKEMGDFVCIAIAKCFIIIMIVIYYVNNISFIFMQCMLWTETINNTSNCNHRKWKRIFRHEDHVHNLPKQKG